MAFEIETGIPLTEVLWRRRGRGSIYPFAELKVHESFAVPLKDFSSKRLSSAAAQYAKRHGVKLVVRTLHEEGVARVWRVE